MAGGAISARAERRSRRGEPARVRFLELALQVRALRFERDDLLLQLGRAILMRFRQ